MSNLLIEIQACIRRGNYLASRHASERINGRFLKLWQVAATIDNARLVFEDVDAKPNPKVVVWQVLPDGRQAKAVWSLDRGLPDDRAILVTIYFPE